MISIALFSLIFLIIGLVLGYLLGKGNIPPPSIRVPQTITGALARHKEKITGYTGRVRPLPPKELKERKEIEAMLKFEEEQE